MATLFVQCDVRLGMFKTEYLVSVLPAKNSFYVDRTDVKVGKMPTANEAVSGSVLAYFVEEKKDYTVVEMTGTPIDGGTRISVPTSLTSAA